MAFIIIAHIEDMVGSSSLSQRSTLHIKRTGEYGVKYVISKVAKSTGTGPRMKIDHRRTSVDELRKVEQTLVCPLGYRDPD